MTTCDVCGHSVAEDAEVCPSCGHILVRTTCKICGTKLVNDYERSKGVCINCERDAVSAPVPTPPKYLKRLTFFQVLCYVSAVCSLGLLSILPAAAIAGALGGICLATIFGALREIISRLQ